MDKIIDLCTYYDESDDKHYVKGIWVENGYTSFSSIITEKMSEQKATKIVKKHLKNGTVVCCVCGKTIPRDSNKHFAGYFCSEHWETYKEANGGECSKCKSPRYVCSC